MCSIKENLLKWKWGETRRREGRTHNLPLSLFFPPFLSCIERGLLAFRKSFLLPLLLNYACFKWPILSSTQLHNSSLTLVRKVPSGAIPTGRIGKLEA